MRDDAFARGPSTKPRAAARAGEVPVGAAIARDGVVIAAAGNRTLAHRDPTAHAEMLAIRAACAALDSERLAGCDLYVTLEPCAMCAGAISFARLRRLYYARRRPEGRRRRPRRALLRPADLPSRAGGLWRHPRGRGGRNAAGLLQGASGQVRDGQVEPEGGMCRARSMPSWRIRTTSMMLGPTGR